MQQIGEQILHFSNLSYHVINISKEQTCLKTSSSQRLRKCACTCTCMRIYALFQDSSYAKIICHLSLHAHVLGVLIYSIAKLVP